jgi:hypothetical protein
MYFYHIGMFVEANRTTAGTTAVQAIADSATKLDSDDLLAGPAVVLGEGIVLPVRNIEGMAIEKNLFETGN